MLAVYHIIFITMRFLFYKQIIFPLPMHRQETGKPEHGERFSSERSRGITQSALGELRALQCCITEKASGIFKWGDLQTQCTFEYAYW